MDFKKVKYTVSWTQHPKDWNIPGMIKLLENARTKILDLENQRLEDFSIKETKKLLDKIKSMR